MAKKDKIKVKGGSATATSAAGAASKASKGGGKVNLTCFWFQLDHAVVACIRK